MSEAIEMEVQVNGLQINIPPREMWQQASKQPRKDGGKIKIGSTARATWSAWVISSVFFC